MIFAFLLVGLVSLTIINQTTGDDKQCPSIYQRYCDHHSGCLSPNDNCEILAYYPTSKEIKQIVDLHNSKRSEVAVGQTGLPPAKSMMMMEWDSELAGVAQSYANQCVYEHDEGNCRRVQNFGVGQNLAIQKQTGGHTVPQPDWEFAINEWFNEIQYFSSDLICPFKPPDSSNQEYRHFTQLAWGESFRVGCGYVLYKEGNIFKDETYTRLYVCNYGPAGNVYGSCVYETGTTCSNCPMNTLCSSSCSGYQSDPSCNSLCGRTGQDPPEYAPPQPNLFYCAFQTDKTNNCDNYIVGNPNWLIEPTLGGNYLGIVLNGGENSTIVFTHDIKPNAEKFCVVTKYRKGPNKYEDQMSSDAQIFLYIAEQNYIAPQALPGYDNPARQMFSVFNLTLTWSFKTQLKYSFAVPPGASPQFFNVKSILVVDGECQ